MPFLGFGKEHDGRMNGANNVVWGGDAYTPSPIFERKSEPGDSAPVSLAPAARQVCGNAECAGGWTAPWRSRRRPIFEGRWGCGGRCVLSMVRAALRRESGERAATADVPHRHRVPLGLVMLAQGWITHEQLRRALDAQRQHGTGRIGDWLIAECGVDAERVTRGLSVQWNCPVLTTEGFSPEAMSRVMPRLFVEEFGLLPLRVAGARILYLGFESRLDASVAFAVEQMTDLQASSGLVNEAQFAAARDRLLECDGVAIKSETSPDADALAARVTAILEHRQPVASRLARVHGYFWLRLWLESAALGRAGNLPGSGEDVMDYVFSVGVEP